MTARVIPFPAAVRVRITPLEARLAVLELAEPILRDQQEHEQRRGKFSRQLSLVIEWLDLLEDWETAA